MDDDFNLEPDVVREVLIGLLKEADENRWYLMSVIKQLEKNFAVERDALENNYARVASELAGYRLAEKQEPEIIDVTVDDLYSCNCSGDQYCIECATP